MGRATITCPVAMSAPASHDEIREVNERYHDVAAESYDGKWGIDFGPKGAKQVLGKMAKALGGLPGRPYERSLEIGSGAGHFSPKLLLGGGHLQRAARGIPARELG